MRTVVGIATKSRIAFARDIESELLGGTTLQQILDQVVRDRLKFAGDFLAVANDLLTSGLQTANTAAIRSSISRYYYAMFQAARGVAFWAHGGDDKSSHADLPNAIPDDFRYRKNRINDLKSTRSSRNDADYDPYPDDVVHWTQLAIDTKGVAELFVSECVSYVTDKGF